MEMLVILTTSIFLLFISMTGMYESIGGNNKFMGFITILSTVLISVTLMSALSLKEKPKAMDVYRGKTTLVITYKDRVPIDSTVVWKNK